MGAVGKAKICKNYANTETLNTRRKRRIQTSQRTIRKEEKAIKNS
jgi:hypothetical protein